MNAASGRLRPSDIAWEQFHDPHDRPTTPIRVLKADDPYTIEADFPPDFYAADHWHPHDTLYVFTKGEMRIGEEGSFFPGDIRWVKAGHIYGPEEAGPDGVTFYLVSLGGEVGLNWADIYDVPEALQDRLSTLKDLWGRVNFADVPFQEGSAPGHEVQVLHNASPRLIRERFAPDGDGFTTSHAASSLTFVLDGRLHVDGEGWFEAGDIRWAHGQQAGAPVKTDSNGATTIMIDLLA